MPTKTTFLGLTFVLSFGIALRAQTPADPRSTAERLRYFAITSIPAAANARNAMADDIADSFGTHLSAFVYYAIPPTVITDSFKDFLHTANKMRVDQQLGSSFSAASSAVARTGISTLFDVALETGAISKTIDQNVVTIRTNADGLVKFLSNQDIFTPCPPDDTQCSRATYLRNFEASSSFTANEAGSQTLSGNIASNPSGPPVGFIAPFNAQKFVSATGRYSLMNNRDLRSDAYREKWLVWFEKNEPALSAAGADLIGYANDLIQKALNTPGTMYDVYTDWVEETRAALYAAPPTVDRWQATFAKRLDVLIELMRRVDPQFETRLLELSHAYARYIAVRRDLLSALIVDPGLTLEYTYAEPEAEAPQHSVRVAFAYSPKGPRGTANPGTITFNGAIEWYRDPQTIAPGQSVRWKDAQAALQFDRPLGPADSAGQLSIGAYYQYQMNPGIIVIPAGAVTLPGTIVRLPASGGALLAEKGSIFAAQATLTLRIAGGVKVPIGFSWANRTELVTGSQVRGHVGITFDTAPLFLLTGLRQ